MKRVLPLAIAITVMCPISAVAGGSAVIEMQRAVLPGSAETGQSRVAWRDLENVRMEMPGNGSYILEQAGKVYSVAMIGGQMRVLDMASMMKMANVAAMSGPGQMPGVGTVSNFTDTGQTRVEAGIEGRVYSVDIEGESGETHRTEMVLTKDPLVRDMTKAYLGMMAAMVGSVSPDATAGDWLSNMPHPYDGILAVKDQYKLVSVSDQTPDASKFDLPGKPLDLGTLMNGFSN
jgi:hypothetical protein